jgi:hypothetical protein
MSNVVQNYPEISLVCHNNLPQISLTDRFSATNYSLFSFWSRAFFVNKCTFCYVNQIFGNKEFVILNSLGSLGFGNSNNIDCSLL